MAKSKKGIYFVRRNQHEGQRLSEYTLENSGQRSANPYWFGRSFLSIFAKYLSASLFTPCITKRTGVLQVRRRENIVSG